MLTDSSQLFWLDLNSFCFQLTFNWLISTFSSCLVSPHAASFPLWEMVSAESVLKIWCDFMTNFSGYVLREIGKNTRWGNWWSWPLTQHLMRQTLLNLLGGWGGSEGWWVFISFLSEAETSETLFLSLQLHRLSVATQCCCHYYWQKDLILSLGLKNVDWMARSFVLNTKDSVTNHKSKQEAFKMHPWAELKRHGVTQEDFCFITMGVAPNF